MSLVDEFARRGPVLGERVSDETLRELRWDASLVGQVSRTQLAGKWVCENQHRFGRNSPTPGRAKCPECGSSLVRYVYDPSVASVDAHADRAEDR